MPKDDKKKNVHAECDKQIETLKHAVATKDSAIADLSERVKKVKTACCNTVAEYKTQFDALKAKLATAEEELKIAESIRQAEKKEAVARVAALNEAHGKLVKRLRDTAAAERDALALELANANERIVRFDAQVEDLTAGCGDLKTQLQDAKKAACSCETCTDQA